jgi:hypothetical protein
MGNGGRQLLKGCLIELGTRLEGIAVNEVDGKFEGGAGRGSAGAARTIAVCFCRDGCDGRSLGGCRRLRTMWQQCFQALA